MVVVKKAKPKVDKEEKRGYYDISNLLSTNAEYMMLLGKRSNGKSYQVKETVLSDAYNNNIKFVYLRRWRDDIRNVNVQAYFADMPIKKITNGEFDGVRVTASVIYFVDTEDKAHKREIGRSCSLNERERYKSMAFQTEDVYYKYIVFEEFITDVSYLSMYEPTYLQQFVSTVARDRKMTVFLIGNTISRVCPYFAEWSLEGVLAQKQGTIEVYHHHIKIDSEESVINIAVENCANNSAKNKMFFGETAKQIVSGEWETHDQPKLPRKHEEYEMVYEVELRFQKFNFVLQLLVEPIDGGVITFIYRKTTKRKIDRIITEVFSDNPFITYSLNRNNVAEERISECIRNNKVCFSDNLTGTDFKTILSEFPFT